MLGILVRFHTIIRRGVGWAASRRALRVWFFVGVAQVGRGWRMDTFGGRSSFIQGLLVTVGVWGWCM